MNEKEILRNALNKFPIRKGTQVLICPKCNNIVREYPIEINTLNKWAFKDEIAVAFDGKGCCF